MLELAMYSYLHKTFKKVLVVFELLAQNNLSSHPSKPS